MAKRRPKRTASEIAEDHAATLVRKEKVEALRASGAFVVVDTKWNIIAAERADLFADLRQRKCITDQEYEAIRRLETDMAATMGCDNIGANLLGSRASSEGAPGQHVTQRMVDASRRVQETMKRIGPGAAALLEALLMPQFIGTTNDKGHCTGAVITRWRETVQRVTKETNDRAQVAMIRAAASNLVIVYSEIDNAKPEKPTNYIGEMNARVA